MAHDASDGGAVDDDLFDDLFDVELHRLRQRRQIEFRFRCIFVVDDDDGGRQTIKK